LSASRREEKLATRLGGRVEAAEAAEAAAEAGEGKVDDSTLVS
jgi:hypothetical protein